MSPPLATPVMGTRTFVMLTLSYALASVHFWMTVPLAAIALAERGVPPWQIGAIGSVPWLALVLLVPFVPLAAARFGVVTIFRLGIATALAGSLCFLLSTSIAGWVAGYALTGAGIALRWIVADAVVATMAPAGQRGHRVGLFETTVGATMALGPLILTIFGTASTLPFLIGIGLVAAAGLASLFVDMPRLSLPRHGLRQSFGAILLVSRKAPLALMAAVLSGALEGMTTKLVPVQAIGIGFPEQVAAATVVALGAGNIFIQYPLGRFADRIGVHRLATWILALIVLCAILLPASMVAATPYLGVLAILGGLIGCFYTLSIIEAGAQGSVGDAMGTMAAISIGYTAGSVLGPLAGGLATSLDLVLGLTVLIGLMAAAGFVAMVRRSRQV